MNEHPILFSGPMVRAILEGRKTQTRRVMKPQPDEGKMRWTGSHWEMYLGYPIGHDVPISLYGQPGDLLWVRETWGTILDCEGYIYRADGPHDGVRRWYPSIHMPRVASRLTLRITDVRVQRVQEISEEDARDEGTSGLLTSMTGFPYLWNAINAKRGYCWADNPWVWALTFERVR